IHEQNAIAGTTNRALARFASRVFEAFPASFPAGIAAECIGNPVRRSIAALPPAAERVAELATVGPAKDERAATATTAASAGRRARLLVVGGSQGARALNVTMPAALARLPEALRPEVLHQAGRSADDARAAYAEAG